MPRSRVDVVTSDGTADAYLSGPDGEGSCPGVLVLPDAFGLRSQIENMAIADMDLTKPDSRAAFMEKPKPFREELISARVIADGAAYLDFLARISAGPAVYGYCMGGRLGWYIAAALPDRVRALAAFHPVG